MRVKFVTVIACLLLLFDHCCAKDESTSSWQLAGFIAADYRQFLQGAAHPMQRFGSGVTPTLEPELYWTTEDNSDTLTLRPYLHLDYFDAERSSFDIHQADYVHASKNWEVRVTLILHKGNSL